MADVKIVFLLFVAAFCVANSAPDSAKLYSKKSKSRLGDGGKETWGYVNVKENGYMFWWLYYSTAGNSSYLQQPLVMWLQGGPGASSSGFGNFGELGPLDIEQKERNYTWVKSANILFVDNPVGTGFSYVTNNSALATNNSQIVDDLIVFMKAIFQKLPDLQTMPFYIFSESYGGKMAIGLAYTLYKYVHSGKIPCNFQGVVLGDSWISPIDSVSTWGPFLYSTSMVDEVGLDAINTMAGKVRSALNNGQFKNATELFESVQTTVENYTHGINFYNILNLSFAKSYSECCRNTAFPPYINKMYQRIVRTDDDDALSKLMNGPIRQKLRIIPENVTWGGQSQLVFSALSEDFMKPVTDSVELVLNNTSLMVVVLSGQLDLIVDSLGTMKWVKNIKWAGINGFLNAERVPIQLNNNSVAGFVKQYKNLAFYWILNAGHMIPRDAAATSVKMLNMITKTNNMPK